jgi:hypothetical protein
MSKLTTARRKKLPASAFVFPKGTKAAPKVRKFPIDTAARGRNALSRAGQKATRLTHDERCKVVRAVCRRHNICHSFKASSLLAGCAKSESR